MFAGSDEASMLKRDATISCNEAVSHHDCAM